MASAPLLSAAAAEGLFASSTNFSDYKAIVILQFYGGNDSFNTFIPTDSTHHSDYAAVRQKISVFDTDLTKDTYYNKDANGYYTSSDKSKNPYAGNDLESVYRKGMYKVGGELGFHGLMPELAALYEKRVLSVVSNVGTLVKPTTYDDIANKTADLPLFLFAHDHQRRAIATAYAQSRINSGWLGRVADAWSPINGKIGLNVSYHGLDMMVTGKDTSPLVFGEKPDLFKNKDIPPIIEAFAKTKDSNIFESYYKRLNLDAKEFSDTFKSVWNDAVDFSTFSAKNSYGDALFSVPKTSDIGLDVHGLDSRLFKYLESIARFIKIGKEHFGYKRQVFYMVMGGFDFHSGQMVDHTQRLRSISLAVSDFYKALEEMGLQEKVLLATTSDFGRTLLSNGDGTDHGWGGHQFVMCGDSNFNGGEIVGKSVDNYKLEDTNTNFYPSRNIKGRLIPTTSIEQMFAPVLDWFGVDERTMKSAFPNLANFQTQSGDYKSAFLAGLFS